LENNILKWYFIVSDGSSNLYHVDPFASFSVVKTVQVKYKGNSISNLNELEMYKGLVLANIFTKNLVAAINPETGNVVNMIDFTYLTTLMQQIPGY
jgi:glutamine cyclotransferase